MKYSIRRESARNHQRNQRAVAVGRKNSASGVQLRNRPKVAGYRPVGCAIGI